MASELQFSEPSVMCTRPKSVAKRGIQVFRMACKNDGGGQLWPFGRYMPCLFDSEAHGVGEWACSDGLLSIFQNSIDSFHALARRENGKRKASAGDCGRYTLSDSPCSEINHDTQRRIPG